VNDLAATQDQGANPDLSTSRDLAATPDFATPDLPHQPIVDLALPDLSQSTADLAMPGGAFPWLKLQAGVWGICGLTTTHSLYCWGANPDNGQTNASPTPAAGGMTFDSVDVDAHVCGLKNGQLYCWGLNDQGQAGVTSATPAAVFAGMTFASVSAGRSESCALTPAGALYCWGGAYGAPGNGANLVAGSYQAVSASQDLVCALDATGGAHCWGANAATFGALGGQTYVAISADFRSACGLVADGSAWCWGDNSNCSLGIGVAGTYEPTPKSVALPNGVKLRDLQMGCFASCGLSTTGDVYCWNARNTWGTLGNGATDMAPHPTPTKVPGLPTMASITVGKGTEFICGLSVTGQRWCWGTDMYGQLGSGNITNVVPSPIQVP
jgi:alpha-tubulin suppressor-like RCC1 family protein